MVFLIKRFLFLYIFLANFVLSAAEVTADSTKAKVYLKPTHSEKVNQKKKGWYAVQVGIFREKSNADKLEQDLKDQDFFMEVFLTDHKTLGQVYIVRTKEMRYYKARSYRKIIADTTQLKPAIVKIKP